MCHTHCWPQYLIYSICVQASKRKLTLKQGINWSDTLVPLKQSECIATIINDTKIPIYASSSTKHCTVVKNSFKRKGSYEVPGMKYPNQWQVFPNWSTITLIVKPKIEIISGIRDITDKATEFVLLLYHSVYGVFGSALKISVLIFSCTDLPEITPHSWSGTTNRQRKSLLLYLLCLYYRRLCAVDITKWLEKAWSWYLSKFWPA